MATTQAPATASSGIERVRQFNRTVTQRIGALSDHYLARDRPLGASRVLWEIGDEGTDVRALRERLELDSGYLSRLLRTLESEDLVTVGPNPADQRTRIVQLTSRGRAERAELDRRSDVLAASLLDPLDAARQSLLLDAMWTVERLLTAGLVRIDVENPLGAAATRCLHQYFAELDTRFDGGFDVSQSGAADLRTFAEPSGVFLVARLHGEPIGCGGVRDRAGRAAHIARMWVAPDARGLGVGRRILSALEAHARTRGAKTVVLDTNRRLPEAIAMYRSSGYVEVAPFSDEHYAHHWFEKRLTPVR